jgi:hypothetical protein
LEKEMADEDVEMTKNTGEEEDGTRSPIDTDIAKGDLEVDEEEFRDATQEDDDDDDTSTDDENQRPSSQDAPTVDANGNGVENNQQTPESDGTELELLKALQTMCRNPTASHENIAEAKEKLMPIRRVLVHKVHSQSRKRA